MRIGTVSIHLEDKEASELCRPGAGADTCIWLVMGQDGWECLYYNRAEGRNLLGETLEEKWKAGNTVAKRDGCDEVKQFGDDISFIVLEKIKKFHAHLDICEQCRNHPFGLCSEGALLLKDAGEPTIKRR